MSTRHLKKKPTDKVYDDSGRTGGFTMAEIDRRNAAVYRAQPLTVACARCSWSLSGQAGEALAAAAEHRKGCAA